MSFTQMGFHNLIQPGFNAVQFSLMGMSLVFAGLLIIAFYIALLPKILALFSPKPVLIQETGEQNNKQEEEILLAIITALHMHNNFPDGDERITWKSHGDMDSPWLVSGRMNGLNNRKLSNGWSR